jgi:hypothetical protein
MAAQPALDAAATSHHQSLAQSALPAAHGRCPTHPSPRIEKQILVATNE